MKSEEKISLYQQIANIGPGESMCFPIEKTFTIRVYVSNINLISGKKDLSTKLDREAGIVIVERA